MGAVCDSTTDSNKKFDKENVVTSNKKNSKETSQNPKVESINKVKIDSKGIIQLKTGTPLDNYKILDKLGEGAYGEVYQVMNKDMGIPRAMKKINLSQSNNQSKLKEILNEIEMLKSIDHPNIVKVFEFYSTKEGYFIITELCQGGELFDKIISNGPFEENAAAYIMFQILSAVYFCHNMNIIHRDLKPENILLEEKEKNTRFYDVKIIDFGAAKIFDKSTGEKKVIGSAYYIAPEVLNQNYNEKCDIWSCGVIMYILLSGKPPFSGEDNEIFEKIKKGKFEMKGELWSKISSEAKELIKSMMEMNVLSRSSAQKALNSKWFKKFKTREKFTNVGEDKLKTSLANIRKYKCDNKLAQSALTFLIHNSLHLPEIKDIMKIFKNLDSNNDGRITKPEMMEALGKIYNLPDNEDEVDEIFKNVDNDNNGYIEYEEYIRASIDKGLVLNDSVLRYTFKYFDKDSSGQISAEEIVNEIFKDVDKTKAIEFAKLLMKEIDSDENAQINYDEFKKMMINLLN